MSPIQMSRFSEAVLQGWITDTVDVVVNGDETPASALFAERFESLDTTRWMVRGDPQPLPVRVDGGPALALRGDGIGNDLLQTHR